MCLAKRFHSDKPATSTGREIIICLNQSELENAAPEQQSESHFAAASDLFLPQVPYHDHVFCCCFIEKALLSVPVAFPTSCELRNLLGNMFALARKSGN